MEKLDNVRIGFNYQGLCPIDINKIIEKNSDKIKVQRKNNYSEFYSDTVLKIYKNPINNEAYKKQSSLRLELLQYKGTTKVRISNSLRKWYFGSVSTQDFSIVSLLHCLRLIAEILCIDIKDLLQFKIYKAELGVTFRLPAIYKFILQQLSEHKEYKKYGQFDNFSSIYFNADNIGVICYDVLRKMLDNREISKNVYDKLSNKYFFFRIELKINKRAGVKFTNKHMLTLNDLIKNREKIVRYWGREMNKIRVEENISFKEIESLSNLTPREFKDFVCLKFIDIYTWSKLNALIDLTINNDPKKKYAIKESFRKLQESRVAKKGNKNSIFFKELLNSVK